MTLGCKDIKIRKSELVVKIKFSKVFVVYTRLELRMRKKEAETRFNE